MTIASSKFKKALLATALVFGSAAANAQGSFYAEVGVGPRAATTEVTVSEPSIGSLTADIGKTELLGSLGAGWRWEDGNSVFGAGVFLNPAGKDAGKVTFTDGVDTITAKLEQKEHWGIGAEAGWKLAPPTTLYAKLAWHRAKFRASVDGESRSNRHTGVGFGVGLRHMFDKNTYAFAEWQQVNFNDKTSDFDGVPTKIDPKNTIGLIGVGWKF